MSNPFHKSSRIKCLLSMLMLVAFSFSFTPLASAQGAFDFSDGDDDGFSMGDDDDFNFADDTPQTPLDLSEHFVMPNNGKPVNLVIFEPVDGTPQKTLDSLTEATVDALKDEKYADYDSVKGIPVLQKLSEMSPEDRMMCIDDAECMSNIGAEIGAANIVIGRIYTEGRDRPSVTLDLIDVQNRVNKNSIYFDTQQRLRKQEQDIAGALIRLFNIDTGSLDSLLGQRVVEETNPLPTAQLVSGIVVGVVALAAVGTGIYFGLEAKNYEGKAKDAVTANEDKGIALTNVAKDTSLYDDLESQGYTQRQAKDNLDKAQNYAMIANILYATGAVAAVVSVILFLVRSDKDEDLFANHDVYVSPAVGADGNGGVVAGFSF